jgi:hypothetical protein
MSGQSRVFNRSRRLQAVVAVNDIVAVMPLVPAIVVVLRKQQAALFWQVRLLSLVKLLKVVGP